MSFSLNVTHRTDVKKKEDRDRRGRPRKKLQRIKTRSFGVTTR